LKRKPELDLGVVTYTGEHMCVRYSFDTLETTAMTTQYEWAASDVPSIHDAPAHHEAALQYVVDHPGVSYEDSLERFNLQAVAEASKRPAVNGTPWVTASQDVRSTGQSPAETAARTPSTARKRRAFIGSPRKIHDHSPGTSERLSCTTDPYG
jgi:hypothetical protein